MLIPLGALVSRRLSWFRLAKFGVGGCAVLGHMWALSSFDWAGVDPFGQQAICSFGGLKGIEGAWVQFCLSSIRLKELEHFLRGTSPSCSSEEPCSNWRYANHLLEGGGKGRWLASQQLDARSNCVLIGENGDGLLDVGGSVLCRSVAGGHVGTFWGGRQCRW